MKLSKIFFPALLGGFLLAVLYPAASFSDDIYEAKLNKGLKNSDAYSYLLIKKAEADPSNAKKLLAEAIKYSPDLPAPYFELAKTNFSFSQQGIFGSFAYLGRGFSSYKDNFWWLRSITGLLLASLTASLLSALALAALIRLFVQFPLITHDVKENKNRIWLVVLLVPLAMLGPLYFIAGLFVVLGLYFGKTGKVVVYAAILFLGFSPFVFRTANSFIYSTAPEIRAVVAVNEGRDNKLAITVLKNKDEFEPAFSYALAQKREGNYQEAIAIYKRLLSISEDPVVYINLGNAYFSIKDTPNAKEAYRKSIDMEPSSAAYYNLSQVSRDTLDFSKGEEYYKEAAKLDRDAVSKFTAIVTKDPNRFVVDEKLSTGAMWKYADKSFQKNKEAALNPLAAAASAIFLFLLCIVLTKNIRHIASRCARCGAVVCGKCARGTLQNRICRECNKFFVKLEDIDPRERVAKLLEIQERKTRKSGLMKLFSLAPPGAANIFTGRILSGTLLLWTFLFLLFLTLLNPLTSTGLYTFTHSWLTVPAIALMGLMYAKSFLKIMRRS